MVVHFILPFLVLLVLVIHLNILHLTGSTNLYHSHTNFRKVRFYPIYWGKDIINFLVYYIAIFFMLTFPYSLGEVELFEEANTLNSPIHILPEWYFLSQYAILRSVPSKGIGVLLIFLRIFILFLYPFTRSYVSPISRIRLSI